MALSIARFVGEYTGGASVAPLGIHPSNHITHLSYFIVNAPKYIFISVISHMLFVSILRNFFFPLHGTPGFPQE